MLFVLGSRSPRRRELLEAFVSSDRVVTRPPTDSHEAGFQGLHDTDRIEQQLHTIVDAKMQDVFAQISTEPMFTDQTRCVITADTIVIAEDPAIETIVLGQPDPDGWKVEVTDWMLRLYSGRTHQVWTGFQVACGNRKKTGVVRTEVEFHELNSCLVNRYLATGESPGKAGGYAIQGAAAAFIKRIDGSLANVIGLPMIEVLEACQSVCPDASIP